MRNVEKLKLRGESGGTIVPVKAVPGSSRDRIAGVLGDELKVATSAAAEKGKANAAIARILAKAVGVDRKAVTLSSGPTNPRKEYLVAGAAPAEVRDILRAL